MTTLQIDVPDAVARLIETRMRERQLSQAGEYIQELVQADVAQGRQRRIDAAILEALQSDPGSDIELTDEWWTAKRATLASQLS
ncbi:MAG: type II toxin-antitoxin system ParD family antitoxin [Candidatus Saccharimonas sp.]|nr:type II toxin-antitoxin system ParD family antitoxin [Planctomycetaceae bacterium]